MTLTQAKRRRRVLAAAVLIVGFVVVPTTEYNFVHSSHQTTGCWDESNSYMPNGLERICGDLDLMPPHSIRVDDLQGSDEK